MESDSRFGGLWAKHGTLDARVRLFMRLAGLVLIFLGAAPLMRGSAPSVFGLKATGQVVEIRERSEQGPGHRYSAVIDFAAEDGDAARVKRRFRHRLSRRSPSLTVGDQVSVAYFRRKPEQAEVQDHRAEWVDGVGPVFVGILLTALSFAPAGSRKGT